jgi:hypothetical protein
MMKKEQIKKQILNFYPLIISFAIFIVIILLHPFDFEKYETKLVREIHRTNNSFYSYADLNGDNVSEKIRFVYMKRRNQSGIVVYENNRILDQWNFEGKIYLKDVGFFVGDYNLNGYKEITLFTYYKDSIYLHMIEPFSEKKFQVGEKTYSEFSRGLIGIDNSDFRIRKGGLAEFDKDPNRELYFSITPGALITQPRRVCIYNIAEDTLKISPKAGIPLYNIRAFDIAGDTIPEIIGDAYAYGNLPEDFPYTDMRGWLMVFNSDLEFVFNPVPFREYPMKLFVQPCKTDNKRFLFVYHQYYGIKKEIDPGLLIYNKKGVLVKEKKLTGIEYPRRTSILSNNGKLYFFTCNEKVRMLDKNLNIKNEWRVPGILNGNVKFKGDINGDHRNELLFKGKGECEFIITQNNIKHPVSINVPFHNNYFHFAIKKEAGGERYLFVQTDKTASIYSYEKNPIYTFRYFLYAALLGGILFTVWLIKILQTRIIRNNYETQRKINELQLKTIKNKIEPHFTFNLMNSISSILYDGDAEKANFIIVKYSNLLRNIVVNSEKFIIPLSKEIEYIENYLEIEKYRLNEKFTFKTDIHPEVNQDIPIPKMLVFTFVENAVKHGIKPLRGEGFIHLELSKNQRYHLIEIKDNGIGRDKSSDTISNSTKSGLKTIDQILKHYAQIQKRKIQYKIAPLNENSDKQPGTHVKIFLPYGKKK